MLEGEWLSYVDKSYMLTRTVKRGNMGYIGRTACRGVSLHILVLLHLIPLMGLDGKRY